MRIQPFVVGYIQTNCYLVWDEKSGEAMVVDPGAFDPMILRWLSENGLRLKYIALTHGHSDHIGGVAELKERFPDVTVAAAQKETALMGDPVLNESRAFFRKEMSVIPDLELEAGDDLTLGRLSFRVIETPGHTPGGIAFYIQDRDESLFGGFFSGTAFTGDTLFRASVGRTDLHGGDFSALAASIKEKLFALPDDTLVLPGHMNETTIGYEKTNNPFVR